MLLPPPTAAKNVTQEMGLRFHATSATTLGTARKSIAQFKQCELHAHFSIQSSIKLKKKSHWSILVIFLLLSIFYKYEKLLKKSSNAKIQRLRILNIKETMWRI